VPKQFSITIKPMDGTLATFITRTDISVRENWVMGQISKPGDWNEAIGAVIYSLGIVVEQNHNPNWLITGIADYYRWFHFEPVEHRPTMSAQSAAGHKYSDGFQTTAGFLAYLVKRHDPNLVLKLTAAIRRGRYSDDLWKESTGMSVEDLWAEYVKSL
jgi:hypothetical protein